MRCRRWSGHPNREAFRGVLTLVDVASDKPPAGARGHRVVLTRAAAEAALASLLGMALDYSPSLDRHDAQRKVGVITRAEIVGRQLELGGHLFAKDFPEIVRRSKVGDSGAACIGGQNAGDVLRNYGCAGGRRAGQGLDADAGDVHRGGDFAAGQGGVSGDVD